MRIYLLKGLSPACLTFTHIGTTDLQAQMVNFMDCTSSEGVHGVHGSWLSQPAPAYGLWGAVPTWKGLFWYKSKNKIRSLDL